MPVSISICRTGPGEELAELLWDRGPALRRAPPPFQPFTCSAAGSSRSQELKRHASDTTKASAFVTAVSVPLGTHDAGSGLGLAGLPVHDDDDAVPWLHCPVADDGDGDTAPLPPEFCAGLLSEYSEVAAPAPAFHAAATPPAEAAANKLAPPSAAGGGEGVLNFTFFARPLQRPQAAAAPAAAAASNPVESTVVQAAANRLRSTPLFSEQRMAWLQPPKAPRTTAAAAAPPPPPLAPLLPDSRHGETVGTVAQPQPRSQPEARPPDAAAVTTSSVCSGNGGRSQLKRSRHLAADCSVSPDEVVIACPTRRPRSPLHPLIQSNIPAPPSMYPFSYLQDLDDEPGATRRSAARSAKRCRTAEVHNLSERVRAARSLPLSSLHALAMSTCMPSH
jgi:phytochrome-interacting factor 3